MLYPNKNGTVADLLEEAGKQVQLSDSGSGHLRLLEIVGHKIVSLVKEFTHLDTLPVGSAKVGTEHCRICSLMRSVLSERTP